LYQKTVYSDKELLEGIANGDTKVLEHLYNECFKTIRHLVVSNNGDIEDAKDIFQESIIVLLRKVREKDFRLTSSLTTFIYSIAHLMWLKELNLRTKRAVPAKTTDHYTDEELLLIDAIDRNERLKLYREKFEELSQNCKKVLRMFLNNIPIKEITKIMGYSSDQHTKNRRFRCKKSLVLKIKNSSKYKELSNEIHQNDRNLPRW